MADEQPLTAMRTTYELPQGEPVTALALSSGVTVTSPILVRAQLPDCPDLELRLEVDGGKLVLTRLTLSRSAGEPPIGQSLLRELPLAAIVKEVRRRVALAFTVFDQLGARADGTLPLLPAALLGLQPGRPRGGTRRVIDDDLLDEVERIVAGHPEAPTRAVQQRLGTSHRNATRWIAAARARGGAAESLPAR